MTRKPTKPCPTCGRCPTCGNVPNYGHRYWHLDSTPHWGPMAPYEIPRAGQPLQDSPVSQTTGD